MRFTQELTMDEPLLKVEEEDQKSGSGDNSTTNEFSLSDIASQQDADSTLHDGIYHCI